MLKVYLNILVLWKKKKFKKLYIKVSAKIIKRNADGHLKVFVKRMIYCGFNLIKKIDLNWWED